jgi:hypothetical protein
VAPFVGDLFRETLEIDDDLLEDLLIDAAGGVI